MKAVAIAIITLYLSMVAGQANFDEYKTKFNKAYPNAYDNNLRMSYYTNQMAFINAHNSYYKAGIYTFELAPNMLTDIGYINNFVYNFPVLPPDTVIPKGKEITLNKDNLPESFELVIPRGQPRDQSLNANATVLKSCNAGWAFAVAKALEIYQFNHVDENSRVPGVYSAQQLIDCLPCGMCQKGLPHIALQFLTSPSTFIFREKSYNPYTGVNSFCAPDISKYVDTYNIMAFSTLPDNATEDDIKSVLVNLKSPVIFEINPASELFMNYKGGLYSQTYPNPAIGTVGSHFMVITGYGSGTEDRAFAAPANKSTNYWKVLNSFGSTWGDRGFMMLQRDTAKLRKLVFVTE